MITPWARLGAVSATAMAEAQISLVTSLLFMMVLPLWSAILQGEFSEGANPDRDWDPRIPDCATLHINMIG